MMGLLRYRVRQRTFLAYQQADQQTVQAFVEYFDPAGDVLLYRPDLAQADLAPPGLDEHLTLHRIRTLYLDDSTVTLVLLGAQTWDDPAIDWLLRASLLEQGQTPANGLLGLVLPGGDGEVRLPLRLQHNLGSGYALLYPLTYRLGQFAAYIEEAAARRSQGHLVVR